MWAPNRIAAATVAAVPQIRSSLGRSSILPMKDFREVPTSSGNPDRASRPRFRSASRFWSDVLPKPMPGSRISFWADTPELRARATASSAQPSISRMMSELGGRVCIVAGSPREWARTSAAPTRAASSASPGPGRRPETSFTSAAPRSSAARATSGLRVSIEIGSGYDSSPSSTGSTRSSSSAVDTVSEPGRVDSPPMSRMSAPSSAMAQARAIAAAGSRKRPPSKNESGVTLSTPMMHVLEPLHFLIDLDRRVLAVVAVLRDLAAKEDLLFLLAEGERAHRLAHTPLGDHLAGTLGRDLDVVGGAGGQGVEEDLLGAAPPHQDGDLTLDELLRVVVLVGLRKLLRQAERHPAGDDRHLVQRIASGHHGGDQGVSALMVGRHLLVVLGDDHGLALLAHEHLVLGPLEVRHHHELAVVAGRVERRLVDQVGQRRAREARRSARDHGDLDVVVERDLARVHPQDSLAPTYVRERHHHLPVEAARPEQRRIEDVGPVAGGDQDHPVVRFE